MDARDELEQFSELVRAERGALAACARREGLSAEDAIDCVQEALSTLLAMSRSGRAPAARREWPAFLMGIVRNAARNRRRRHDRARPHEDVERSALSAAHDLEELLEKAEAHVRLRACVDDLCEIQRAVITLRMLEERPGEDVARALGITAGHVAVLLYRAKASLRACMTG